VAFLDLVPAAVVSVRALALESMFPEDLRRALGQVPYDVAAAVAPPEAVEAAGVPEARLGDILVFAGAELRARFRDEEPCDARRLLGVLSAGLSPWLGRQGAPQWEDDERSESLMAASARFAGLSTIPFERVHAAWRRRLEEYMRGSPATSADKPEVDGEHLRATLAALARLRGR
jgi:hypothetical protein